MLTPDPPSDVPSRSSTPGSPSRSLYDATTAIDDLTRSLANFSRVATPEPVNASGCCCAAEDCEYTKAWLAVKSKLESRLVLSAVEVGQALLQRHEAYVRRVQLQVRNPSEAEADTGVLEDSTRTRQELEARVAELVRENAVLEKRFNQSLVNNEVAESSNKALTTELQEVRAVFSRMTAENARSAGWELRLRQALQERDDFRQERDNESQRARIAEARLVALGDKCSNLRSQVRRLQEDLEQQRINRSELSEEILRDARARLQELQHSQFEHPTLAQHDEVTKILESLVADREMLKQSNAELQVLLSESRENLHALQEEAEEHRASTGLPLDAETLFARRSRKLRSPSPAMSYGTAPGPLSPISSIFHPQTGRRSASTEPPHRGFEPLTPETTRRPLSPTDSLHRSELRYTPLTASFGHRTPVDASFDHDDSVQAAEPGLSPEKPRGAKSLYLLSRSRGVQTDPWPGLLSPHGYSDMTSLSISPNEGRSESSSLVDNPSTLGSLLDRVVHLFNRIAQADALTLTTRLKRQNIVGADVSHLSRNTINSILSEVANLRLLFRGALEDEKFSTACTRKDMRTLLKLFRDVFQELGTVRATLNDIVLDPSLAPKVREMAFNPSKEEAAQAERNTAGASTTASGWMAPLSKLFGSAVGDMKRAVSPSPLGVPGNRGRPAARPIPRAVPKLGPATSASSATVNVEFTGTGAGRAVIHAAAEPLTASTSRDNVAAPVPSRNVSQNLMGIFAGAPRAETGDAWIVIPKAVNALRPQPSTSQLRRATATLGRSAGRNVTDGTIDKGLSQNVDAVIDVQASAEERGFDSALRERTLRPRGLSDSSIRTTFLKHAEEPGSPISEAGRFDHLSRQSVLHALSQKVQGLRIAAGNTISGTASPEQAASPPAGTTAFAPQDTAPPDKPAPRARSPLSGLLPELASWATAGNALDLQESDDYVGSLRQGPAFRPPWDQGGRGAERYEVDRGI
ncbi:hypothetical protein BV25DRAFT_1797971 [Artomyces pyxidatus]|uniref:Uncharacterized protein n=1 Tax=Artomyces pyxidatus TaxID=48021 RepID=A0ACB8TC11_9AGAM|nr:hypothetical protein BV25DRAFT_1797971 [Artomyces pyxidatus]